MGSLAVVFLLIYCFGKLARGARYLVHSACHDLERWYHLDDRPYEPIVASSFTQAGIHTRLAIRRLVREMQRITDTRAGSVNADPIALCLCVGPPNAGQRAVACEMASMIGVPLLSLDVRKIKDTARVIHRLRAPWQSSVFSSQRVLFVEHIREATPATLAALDQLVRTGTIQDPAGHTFPLHGSILVVALSMASDVMEDLYPLSERDLREALSRHPALADSYSQQIVARAHVILPCCYPSYDALRAIVVERLPRALTFMGQARLRVDPCVVDALASELEAAGYPLIDIDHLLYDYLAQIVREAPVRRPWLRAVHSGRLVAVEESNQQIVPAMITSPYVRQNARDA
jgi:hypothetical protein